MKKITALIALIILGASISLRADDMQTYLSDTHKMVREGKYQEALDRFIWFHDHALEQEPSMYGVRLSFALSYWKDLGEKYPPAMAALKKTRDDKTMRMEKGEGNRELFHDVTALNRVLKDDNKTVELFRKLDQEQRDLARECWEIAKDPVFAAKSYDLIRKYVENPVNEFARVKAIYEQNTKIYGGKNFGEPFKRFNENKFVVDTIELIRLSLAIDKEKAAKEIQEQALSMIDDDRLRKAISDEKN